MNHLEEIAALVKEKIKLCEKDLALASKMENEIFDLSANDQRRSKLTLAPMMIDELTNELASLKSILNLAIREMQRNEEY